MPASLHLHIVSRANWRTPRLAVIAAITFGVLLGSCGGGSSSGSGAPAPPPGGGSSGWKAGVFAPASNYQALCASPRTGNDPDTGLPWPDRQGTATDENNWLRSWSNDLYLWYSEIVDRNPSQYATSAYFDLLKTDAKTPSGRAKDKFHFAIPTDEWRQYESSGTVAGYGIEWATIASSPPRELAVALVEPSGPAALPGVDMRRGARILEIDGADLINATDTASIDTLNAGLYPDLAGETHTFLVQDPGAAAPRTVTLTSADVTTTPVPVTDWVDTPGGRIGYLLFTTHIRTAEQALINAVDTLQAAAVDDLVLDLRYNGGGYLYIASELGYMIAGAGATSGRTFELTQFNDKHPNVNPVTDEALTPVPFFDAALGFSATAGQVLPTLNLSRVYILTGPDTCSASEAIINALTGVGVDVFQIGATTCGKPYGFYPEDNCGTTYFSIEFRGVNDAGFGDYADGFSPANALTPSGSVLSGCAVADDLDHALGDPAEGRFAAALQYRSTGVCPTPTAIAPFAATKPVLGTASADIRINRPPWQSIRWLGGP